MDMEAPHVWKSFKNEVLYACDEISGKRKLRKKRKHSGKKEKCIHETSQEPIL